MNFHKYFFGDLPEADTQGPDPRKLLNDEKTDRILEKVATGCNPEGDNRLMEGLCDIGVLSNTSGSWRFACPVFLKSDFPTLKKLTESYASAIAEKLVARRADFSARVSELDSRFTPERHLYHLLCGALFDGRFFDRLAAAGALTSSKPQKSGYDYLPVLYEDEPALNALSANILCSYNRLAAEAGVFASFGDAAGDRRDFFRWYQNLQREKSSFVPYKMNIPLPEFREALAEQYASLVNGRPADREFAELFEYFGYTQHGRTAVPIYTPQQMEETVAILDEFTAELILDDLISALRAVSSAPDLTAIKHGVPVPDVANEVYHLLFGQINEALVRVNLAAAPEYHPGEGRYLKCFEIK